MRIVPFDQDRDLALYSLGEEEAFGSSFPGVTVTHELRASFQDNLLRSIESGHWSGFTAVENEPKGFVLLSKSSFYTIPVGYIESIFVQEPFRGLGIAGLLLEFAEDYFRKEGISFVQLDVTRTNEAAIKAYEGNGYVTTRYRMEKHLAL